MCIVEFFFSEHLDVVQFPSVAVTLFVTSLFPAKEVGLCVLE